jgi:hypothetical protein
MSWRSHVIKSIKKVFNTSSDRALNSAPVILIQVDGVEHKGLMGSRITMSDDSVWFHSYGGHAPVCLEEKSK